MKKIDLEIIGREYMKMCLKFHNFWKQSVKTLKTEWNSLLKIEKGPNHDKTHSY